MKSLLLAAIRRPVVASFGTSAAIQGLNAVSGLLLARFLGPIGRGELAAILIWPGVLVTVGSLGLGDAIAYYTARGEAAVEVIVGSAAWIAFAQSLIVLGAGAIVVPVVLGSHGHRIVLYSTLYLVYTPLFLLTVCAMSVLQGLKRFREYQVIRLALIVVVVAGLLVLASQDAIRLPDVVFLYLGSYAAVSATALWFVSQVTPRRPRAELRLIRKLITYGLKSHSVNVSSFVNERFDQLLISIFLAARQLGLYVTAATVTGILALVGQSVSMVALPGIASAPPGHGRRIMIRRYLLLTAGVAAVIAAPLFAAMPYLIPTLFGASYAAAVNPARILVVGSAVLTVTRFAQTVQKGLGKPLAAGFSEAIAFCATIVLLAILLPWLGILGAAIASLVAYSISALWTFISLREELFAGPRRDVALGIDELQSVA